MTSSPRAELHVSYRLDEQTRGYSWVSIQVVREGALPISVLLWAEHHDHMGRAELVRRVIEAVQDVAPAAVCFRAVSEPDSTDPFNYWSPETVRAVTSGAMTVTDLLIT